jgi:hypothetical protein
MTIAAKTVIWDSSFRIALVWASEDTNRFVMAALRAPVAIQLTFGQ